MSQIAKTYVVSPRGKARLLIAVFMLGLPTLICVFASTQSSREWHVSDMMKVFYQFLMIALLGVSFIGGLYFLFVVRTIILDVPGGSVISVARIFGKTIRRKVWSLTLFVGIELKHYPAGSDTDFFQSDVGIRQRSGKIIWLQAFSIKSEQPSPAALAFIKELGQVTGLPHPATKAPIAV